MISIGWKSNWFSNDYMRDSSVIKNIREIPVINEFLKLGKVYWLGGSQNQFKIDHENAIDWSAELAKIPKYNKERFGSTKGYVRWVLDNYEKELKINLPKLDCIFINAFPSFLHKNMLTYLLWYHYAHAKKFTRVFIYDVEMRLVLYSMTRGGHPPGKLWQISGADKIITKKEQARMASSATFIYPIGKIGKAFMEENAPKFRFETFYFVLDESVTPELKIKTKTLKHNLIYIGNDTGRRNAFVRYFKNLPEGYLTVYGGKERGETEGYAENFIKKLENVDFRGKIPHSKVNRRYNHSVACLSLGKPRFDKVTFQSARWMEAVMSGCVLLLPKEMPEAEYYVGKNNVIKGPNHLYKRVEKLRKSPSLRKKVIKWQRKRFRKLFSIDSQMRNLLRWL